MLATVACALGTRSSRSGSSCSRCVVLGFEASGSPFEADEADYVATSRYFGYLVLQHDVSRKEWGSNHWTRTQPPLTRYIVGAWLTALRLRSGEAEPAVRLDGQQLRGEPPEGPRPDRRRAGPLAPADGAARGRRRRAAVSARAAARRPDSPGSRRRCWRCRSPFMRYTLVHTWAEAPLAFFLLLAALLAVSRACQRVLRRRARRWRWAVGLGLALGLASATKLTGLVGRR